MGHVIPFVYEHNETRTEGTHVLLRSTASLRSSSGTGPPLAPRRAVHARPVAAVTAGLFTLVWMSDDAQRYPIAALAAVALAAVAAAICTVGCERRRASN